MQPFVNLDDLESQAREHLDPGIYDFIAGGADDERTLRANRSAFAAVPLIPRVLRKISPKNIETAVELLGSRLDFPCFVSPMSAHGIAHEQAEAETAKGVALAKTLMIAPMLSNVTMEEISQAVSPCWLQLYLNRDPGITRELLRRAESAHYKAIVFTVDQPVNGIRERDIRNRFVFPKSLIFKNLATLKITNVSEAVANAKTDLGWDDYEWLCKHTKLPVVVKGILSKEDAKEAAALGVPAIVISNHGGRQLETDEGSLNALQAIAGQINHHTELLFDGGIRRGTDIFKALAFGAKAVGIGRPVLWGLALGGAEGVAAVFQKLKTELVHTMALCGIDKIEDIRPSFLGRQE